MNGSPLVLAGPIVRRAEKGRVFIWLATRTKVKVKLEIFDIKEYRAYNNGSIEKPPNPVGLGEEESRQVGKNLYVTLVGAQPLSTGTENGNVRKQEFATDTIFGYMLTFFEDNSQEGINLEKLNLLEGPNSIAFRNKDPEKDICLPTFFIRDPKHDLNFVHGSCRKLHGPEEDCLAIADNLLSSNIENVTTRPSVLFLTGDQIYGDDVAYPLIRSLTALGNELLGYEDSLPEGSIRDIPFGKREEIINDQIFAGFSSGEADNHLITFGEYIAMYLFAWNVENWPRYYDIVIPSRVTAREWIKQIENLNRAKRALPAVRRVLANIATYMICDDHDVTDDWNLDGQWRKRVDNSPCGKYIVANALSAYSIFQAWGNDPALFYESLEKTLSYRMKLLQRNGIIDDSERKNLETYFWERSTWGFTAPTFPLTVFLDTRSRRGYSYGEAAELIKVEELSSLDRLVPRSGQPLIIVSPAPVYGLEFMEIAQLYILSTLFGNYKFDLEAWSSNQRGFENFIKFLHDKRPQYCIFVSGDVHYAFTVSASFTMLPRSGAGVISPLYITQLTSSALKNTGLLNQTLGSETLRRSFYYTSVYSLPINIISDRSIPDTVRFGWSRPGLGLLSEFENKIPSLREIKPKLIELLRETRPVWLEIRKYVATTSHSCREGGLDTTDFSALGQDLSPVLGNNNLGQVIIKHPTKELIHRLFYYGDENVIGSDPRRGCKIKKAFLKTVPSSTYAKIVKLIKDETGVDLER